MINNNINIYAKKNIKKFMKKYVDDEIDYQVYIYIYNDEDKQYFYKLTIIKNNK